MQYDNLSPMSQSLIETIGVLSFHLKMDFEKKVLETANEDTFLESCVTLLESILHSPAQYLEKRYHDGMRDSPYFMERIREIHSNILQVLSIPAGMRKWVKEDS